MAMIKPPLFLLNLKQKKVLIKFFIIFYLLTIIPITVSNVITYHYSNKVIENEIKEANSLALKNMVNYTDERLRRIKNNIYILSTVQSLRNILMKTEFKDTQWYDFKRLQSELANIRGSDDMIYDMFMYFSNVDFLINDSGSYDQDSYFDKFNHLEGLDTAAWRKYFSQAYNFEILGTRNMTDRSVSTSTPVKIITILNSFPYFMAPKATLAVFIKENDIRSIVEEYNTKKNLFLIFDKYGNIITQYGQNIIFNKDNVNQFITNMNGGTSGSFRTQINRKELSITYSSSTFTGWTYLSAVPIADISAQSIYIRNNAFLVCMLFVLIGLIISVWLSGVMYKPISTLVEYLNNISKVNKKKDGNIVQNEFVFIKNQFNEICQANEKLIQSLNGEKPYLHENLFTRILKGNISSIEEIYNELKKYDIKLTGNTFVVTSVIVDFYGELHDTEVLQVGIQDIYNKIKGIISTMIMQKFRCFSVDSDVGSISYIINFDTYAHAEDDVYYVYNMIKDYFNSAGYNLRLSIGVGGICDNISGIRNSFIQSMEALKFRSIKEESQLIVYKDIKNRHKNLYDVNVDINPITNYLLGRDYVKGLNIAVGILKGNINCNLPIISMIKVEVMLVKAAVSLLEVKGYSINNAGLNEKHIYNEIESLKFAQEYERHLTDIYVRIKEFIEEKYKSKNEDAVNSAIKYMKENYNRDIYLETIADELNMNRSYLSRFFKEVTGVSFSDYLGRIRIEKSKELLKETDKAIFKICTDIGYFNTNSFIRTFKKFEGMTPGRYREIMWQK